ncbi:MAG: 30S ribosomal protein S20 [Rickettsiales bacterium]|nr:30S ribosomal protein S20 [Rickettsiales bacterium]
MATHKSAEKAARQAEKRRLRNNATESKIKTIIKSARQAISSGDANTSKEAVKKAQSTLAKGVSKGLIKKNTASRITKRLASALKKASGK